MKHIFVILILLLSACAPAKPHWYGVSKTDNFVRELDPTNEFLDKQWGEVLEKEPVKPGKGKVTLKDLERIQTECNQFDWAHKDEKWSTTEEAKAKGWGDCKDAAMCKYRALRLLGLSPSQANLWSGWMGDKYTGHLTLAVEVGKQEYILDSNKDDIVLAKDFMHKEFEPYSRFNEIGWDIN